MKRWYAVYTQPRGEQVAAVNLMRQGIATYFPRYLKRRSHARRVDEVPAPLFARYLFASFDLREAAWRAIRSTRGVVDLVRNGNDPVCVPDGIISEIKARETPEGFVTVGKFLKLARGDAFKIDSGPFAMHTAIFEEERDKERVIALLALLGRQVTVEIPLRAVAPLA